MRVRLELHQDINITVRPCFATHNRTENRQRTNVKLRQKRSIFPQDFYNVLCIHSCTSLRDPSPASSHVRKISASATTSPDDRDFMMIKAPSLSGQMLSELISAGVLAQRDDTKKRSRGAVSPRLRLQQAFGKSGCGRARYLRIGVPEFRIFSCISGLSRMTSSALYEPFGAGSSSFRNSCCAATA